MTGNQSPRDPGWLRRWWPFYLVLGALAFAVPETVALASPGDGGTLSEMTREWLGISPDGTGGTIGWAVLTVALAGFAIWFPVHLRKGWWWERPKLDQEASQDN